LERTVFLLERLAADAMELAVMLLPLVVYLLILGMGINRAKHPTAVKGEYSLSLVFLAMSGFLLLGPASWIAHLFRSSGLWAYWLAYALYVLGLFLICLSLCMRQRRVLVIYHIEPEQFAAVVQKVLGELNLPYGHTPGRVSFANGRLLMDIETSSLWHNGLLIWRGKENGIRGEVESRVRSALRSVESGSNPACLLLTLLAILFLSYMMFATGLFVLFTN